MIPTNLYLLGGDDRRSAPYDYPYYLHNDEIAARLAGKPGWRSSRHGFPLSHSGNMSRLRPANTHSWHTGAQTVDFYGKRPGGKSIAGDAGGYGVASILDDWRGLCARGAAQDRQSAVLHGRQFGLVRRFHIAVDHHLCTLSPRGMRLSCRGSCSGRTAALANEFFVSILAADLLASLPASAQNSVAGPPMSLGEYWFPDVAVDASGARMLWSGNDRL